MIPPDIYIRMGEVKHLARCLGIEYAVNCSIDFYDYQGQQRFDINYHNKEYDVLYAKSLSVAQYNIFGGAPVGGHVLSKEEELRAEVWHRYSSWRAYKDYFSAPFGSRPTSVILECLTNDDLRELSNSLAWCKGIDNYEYISDQVEKNNERQTGDKARKDIIDFINKYSTPLSSHEQMLLTIRAFCGWVNKSANNYVAARLKIPAKDMEKNPHIVELFSIVEKIKNYTEQTANIMDDFETVMNSVKAADKCTSYREMGSYLNMLEFELGMINQRKKRIKQI